jgi:hypothetical protein
MVKKNKIMELTEEIMNIEISKIFNLFPDFIS